MFKRREYICILNRSTRAASLALPNNSIVDFLDDIQPPELQHFNLAPPSASTINIRRHSSHHCQIIDKVSDEQKSLQTQLVLPLVPPSAQQNNRSSHQHQAAQPQITVTTVPIPSVIPPPVPKRTFQKLIEPPSQPESPQIIENSACSPKIKRRSSKQRSSRKQKSRRQGNGTISKTASYNSVDQSSDDDLLSIESPVFEEECSNDLPVFENSTQFINSNRSSSDSNKSQTTIDTGYMTSASNDNDRIFFGSSTDNYRSRFSSVDTQSSIDSITDAQKVINSPLSGGLIGNKAFSVRNNTAASARMIRNEDGMRRPPVVPIRKQTSVPKIPPPATSVSSRTRGIPPIPPVRSQNSLDSAKMLQNSHILGAFQGNQKNSGQEMYSKPIMKGNASSKPPSLTQIHHSKLTQRQDSNISSDSYSMTSSPGYNTKSMEAPLLQHAAKINKSGIRHQDSNDSFGMAGRYRDGGGVTIRQDSNVSSDSFSQTSSPGYNTKLIDAPLIAHAVKLHTSKILFCMHE